MSNSNKKPKLKKLLIIILICIGIYTYFGSNINFLPVEELYIPSVIGVDINKKSPSDVNYIAAISVYNFNTQSAASSMLQSGKASTLGESRQTRQLHSDHKFILGLEKVLAIGSDFAKYGIRPFINITLDNPNINDTSLMCIYDGKVEDLLKFKVQDYISVGDFLEGLLKRSTDYNFFSGDYELLDIYMRMDAEGRTVVLPFIGIEQDKPTITGMAIFKKDRMVKVLDIRETKIMNLLRENKVKGVLTIKNNPVENIDYYATNKRKVKCKKVGDKYNFLIELNLNGDITSNSLFPNVETDKVMKKKFEGAMSKNVEKQCKDFINKMQNEYKIDCLELGRVAASKYGRHTGVDWNDVISKSKIDVKVNVKINSSGRGAY